MVHKLRLHYVAGLSAELDRFHILDRSVGKLGSDNQIEEGRHTQKNRQPAQCCSAVDHGGGKALLQPAFGEENPQGNQRQSCEEDDWNVNEDDQADVRIVDMPPDLDW